MVFRDRRQIKSDHTVADLPPRGWGDCFSNGSSILSTVAAVFTIHSCNTVFTYWNELAPSWGRADDTVARFCWNQTAEIHSLKYWIPDSNFPPVRNDVNISLPWFSFLWARTLTELSQSDGTKYRRCDCDQINDSMFILTDSQLSRGLELCRVEGWWTQAAHTLSPAHLQTCLCMLLY